MFNGNPIYMVYNEGEARADKTLGWLEVGY